MLFKQLWSLALTSSILHEGTLILSFYNFTSFIIKLISFSHTFLIKLKLSINFNLFFMTTSLLSPTHLHGYETLSWEGHRVGHPRHRLGHTRHRLHRSGQGPLGRQKAQRTRAQVGYTMLKYILYISIWMFSFQ